VTFKEACKRQILVWWLVEQKAWSDAWVNPRCASMHEDYYETHRKDMGHSVNALTEELCTGTFEWDSTGSVLLCTTCFMDGT